MPRLLAVLNIEDSESDSNLVARLLKKADYKITFKRVETADEMRAALKKRAWDIIISDHSLPQFDSYSALSLLREENLDIPFIAVSGSVGEETVAKMMKAGANDYLMKDNLTRLIPAVERELEQAKVRREGKQAENALRESEQKYRALYAMAERREQERALLDKVRTALAHELNLTTILRTVVEAIADTFGYTMVSLYLLRDETLILQHQTGYSNVINEIPITQGVAGRVVRNGLPVLIEDVHADDGFLGAVDNIVSEVCVPLFYEDKIIGILNVESTQNTKLSEADLNLMMALSEHISPAIERARLYTEIRENEKRFRVLIENSADAIALLDAQGIVTYDSPAAPGMLGYDPGERIGESIFELIHADDLPEIQALLQKLTESPGAHVQSLFRVRHKNNSWLWIEAIATNLLNEPGVNAIVVNYRDITQRKQAEETLQASEVRWRTLVQNLPSFIAEVNPDGRILTLNHTQPGFSVNDYEGKSLFNVVAAESRDQFKHAFTRARDEAIMVEYEAPGYGPNREPAWYHRQLVPIVQNGELRSILMVANDITNRKQIETALLQSEQAHRTLFENVPVGLYRTSADGRMLDANPAMVKIFGYQDQESFLAVRAESLYADPNFNEEFNHTMASNDMVTSMEAEFRRKDGTTFWAEDNIKVIRDENGNPLFYEGSLNDITERKRSERALRESEERFHSLFNRMMDGVYRSKHEGKFVDVNPSMVKMFGYSSKEEMLGVDIKNELYFSPEERGSHILDTGKEEMDVYRMRRKDGSEIWVEDHGSYVHDEQGRIIYHEGILRDITERKRANQILAESEARYRQAIAAIDAIPYSLDYESNQYTFIGEEITKLAGYSLTEMNPALLDSLIVESIMLGEFKGMSLEEAVRLIRSGGNGVLWKCEHRIHTRSGDERWLSDSSIQILDDNNIPKGSIGIFQDITERKQAEEKLLQSEERYRELYSNMPAMFFTIDEDGTTLSVNDFGAGQLGYTQEELVGQSVLKVFHEEDKDRAVAYVQNCLENAQQTFQWELRKIRKDGSMLWVKETAWAVKNQQGRLVVLIVCEDITERRLAQEIVHESEARYRSLFEDSPISLWEEDFSRIKLRLNALQNQGVSDFRAHFKTHPQEVHECLTLVKILNVNKATLKLFGATSKDDLMESLARFRDDDPNELFQNELISIAQGKTQFEWEGVNRTLDGRQIIVRLSLSVMQGYEDTLSKVIISMVDITARMHAENAIRESERSLRESQTIAGLGSYVYDIQAEVWTGSHILKQIFGIDDSYVLSGEGWDALVHPEWRQELADYFTNDVLKNRIQFNKEYKIIRNDNGAERWVQGLGELEYDANDQPIRMRGTLRDITEAKQAEINLRESEKRYHSLFEDMPIAIWEEDFSDLKKHLDSLKEQGIKDLRAYFEANPEEMLECDSMIRVLEVNQAALKMYHAESKEALLASLDTGQSEGELENLIDDLIAITEGKTSNNWEGADETLTGKTINISLTWTVVPGHEADFSKVIVTTIDVTERNLIEEALRASEAQFRAIFEGAAIGIALVDPSGHPVKNNVALQEMLGYDTQELRKMVFTEFTHPDDVATDWNLWQKLIDGSRDHYQLEKRLIHKNGHYIWVKLTSSIVPASDGRILFGVGMMEDITERKHAEGESRYQLSELEALYENGLAISRLLEPKRIAQRMVEVIDQKLDWHHAAIRLYDPSTDRVELLALNSPGFNETQIAEQIERINQAINTPDKGLSGWVIRHGEVARIGRIKEDPRYLETYAGINSGLYVPIKTGDEVIGSIAIESEKENAFSERDANTLTTLANQAAISFVNARLYLWLQTELDERHRAEEQVRKLNFELEQRVAERTAQIEVTKRRLELATHAGQIGVWEYNPRENKVIWDERMYMIHQIPVGEFGGSSEAWAELIHPDDLEKSQINKQLAFTKNLLLNNEHRIILPDGSIRYINTSAVTVFAEDGTPDRVIGISIDNTERKHIEQSLRESETYARLLFDAVPDPVSVTEADGLIVDVNKVFEKQYDLVRDVIRGRNMSELGIYPETELSKREKYLAEVLEGRPAEPVELNFYVPGDRVHTLELHSYLLQVNGKQLVLNTAHDITSHKKAEEAQRIAKSEIERALRIKNEFLANMSHELRTPLNSILGISESLEEQIAGPLNEKQLKYIGIVRESGRHLLELINDILDLSKIEAGRMELDIHRISVETLCQSSLRMIKELSQKKSLNVSFKIKGEVGIVLADQRRLKQSLVNLLSNAVKFTPHGKEIGLEVTGNTESNEIYFTVWDQGVGISPEDMKLLFKPFVQLDAGLAREFQGTGLGLALVAQMIHLHGGDVRVESEIGKGSRFIITLPWSPSEQTPNAKVTAELSLPVPRFDEKRNGRILLVEDTDVVVQLISEYLRHKGYEIILAHNGVDAISLATEEHPDLILMDVMMPIMDGLEATRQIRTNEALQTTPIIALTALAMSGDSERCLEAGMNDYLSKPIQMQNLADMIEKYLGTAKEESNEQ